MIASKTTEVKYVRKIRFISYPAGRYDPDTSYVCTEAAGPFVEQDGQYYAMYKEGTWLGSSIGRSPKDDYSMFGTKATWRLMDKYFALIVEMFFADYAKLGSAVFLGDYMFSQYGVTNGVLNSDYHLFNPDNLDAFRPNIYIDWLKGYIELNNAMFRGELNIGQGKNILNKDGSGQLAGGNIRWDKDGAVRFSGDAIWGGTVIFGSARYSIKINDDGTFLYYIDSDASIGNMIWVHTQNDGDTVALPRGSKWDGILLFVYNSSPSIPLKVLMAGESIPARGVGVFFASSFNTDATYWSRIAIVGPSILGVNEIDIN